LESMAAFTYSRSREPTSGGERKTRGMESSLNLRCE
jgi:hypothetical protein